MYYSVHDQMSEQRNKNEKITCKHEIYLRFDSINCTIVRLNENESAVIPGGLVMI